MKTAIVTGGTRGIGAAISIALKKNDYNVIANYAGDEENANQFQKKNNIKVMKWSVGNYEDCKKFSKDIENEFGSIDVLVNNAGIMRDKMFHKLEPKDWQDVINVNLSGLYNMTHPIWTGMRERKFGRIINISSIIGQKGNAGQVNYASAKAGDLGFTKALSQEGASKGITVNAICPGYINTDMVKAVPEKIINEKVIPLIPTGRLGEPNEIARCVVFLADKEAQFINGSTITINGGQFFV